MAHTAHAMAITYNALALGRRVRAMPWQRMVSKLEERLPQEDDTTKRFPAFKEVTFDGLKEILERLGIEHRLGEVLGLRHAPEEQTIE
jgi:hypothetical protein